MAKQSTAMMQYYRCVLLWFWLRYTSAKGGNREEVFVHTLLKMSSKWLPHLCFILIRRMGFPIIYRNQFNSKKQSLILDWPLTLILISLTQMHMHSMLEYRPKNMVIILLSIFVHLLRAFNLNLKRPCWTCIFLGWVLYLCITSDHFRVLLEIKMFLCLPSQVSCWYWM